MHDRSVRRTGVSRGARGPSAPGALVAVGCVAVMVAGCQGGPGDVAVTSPPGHTQAGHPSGAGASTPTRQTSGRGPSDRIIATGYVRSKKIALDVLGLGRVNSTVVALRVRVTNVSDSDDCDVSLLWSDTDDNTGDASMTGGDPWGDLRLVDGVGMKVYQPLTRPSDGTVVQTGFGEGLENTHSVPPGASFVSTILYPAPPAEVKRVDIESGVTEPIQGVPIASDYTLGPGDPQPDEKTNPPFVNVLTQHSVAQDQSGSVKTQGDKTTVEVRSDVLFAFDKATLSKRAGTVLKRVAQRIDRAKATTIHVDGYTDDQGTPERNGPLSRHRAEAAQKKLKALVTRDGLTWVAKGHGAHDPVADNTSKDGRAKNRRVTVTIG